MALAREILRVAAMGDLHCTKSCQGVFRPIFVQAVDKADVLVLCGDLIDAGLPEEAEILAKELGEVGKRLPVLAVLGNHEFEYGKEGEIKRILSDVGAIVLDGESHELDGVGFAGVKGFGGGFGERALEPWGESIIKSFVREAVDEALKLESALARLRTTQRIALLHYSPIRDTVIGEPPEIFPFLGSSRLEEPINRYRVTAVFHGHAHQGKLEGCTKDGVPVYNVAMELLAQSFPNQPPFRVVEIPIERETS